MPIEPTPEPADEALIDALLDEYLASAPDERERVLGEACARHPELAPLLLTRVGALAELGFLDDAPAEPERLGEFRLRELLATGGMGQIWLARQEGLDRDVAVKVLRPDLRVSEVAQQRFLREALAVGRLMHPGIVPVHHLGCDEAGRAFLAMLLVRGRTADRAFDDARAGRDGQSTTSALEIVLKVCDALGYAHEQGVVHRDLKPDNVMVGQFGEVYVMDWGLAAVRGQPEARDLRVAAPRADSDSPLLTVDGSVLGTPCYMPPEQARGELERIDARADVYAAGALLYRLLAGHPPYCDGGVVPRPAAVLAAVEAGPPTAIERLAPESPPELASIAKKAMARDVEDRYRTMVELAADLRAFLEDRVVRAHRTGAVAELRMWIRRNRGLAAGLLATLAVSVIGAVVSSAFAVEANANARELARAIDEFELVSYVVRVDEAVEAERSLYPPWPERVPAIEDWLARHATPLRAGLPRLQDALARLRARAEPVAGGSVLADAEALAARIAVLEDGEARDRERVAAASPDHGAVLRRQTAAAGERLAELESLRRVARAGAAFRLPAPAEQFLHDTLARVVAQLLRFDAAGGLFERVEARHAWALGSVARSIDAQREAWQRAQQEVAADPRFAGFVLPPQIDLVPLGRDPVSGLQEFAHLLSGPPARRAEDGSLVYAEDSGIVFVLVPGGRTRIGAQADDPSAPHHDDMATEREGPVHEVELAPYFIGKHELTQAQWRALSDGEVPASFAMGRPIGLLRFDGRHPVETVTWSDCDELLRRAGLVLPTEAQWEHAARAGTATRYWTGQDRESLRSDGLAANLADRSARNSGARWHDLEDWPDYDDGHPVHAPVGSLRANPFGLFDVHGNVYEWCRDGLGSYELPPRPGDGYRAVEDPDTYACRGGAFSGSAGDARISWRDGIAPDIKLDLLGLRPARAVLDG